ncbi:hypothetical protein FRC07_013098, partial [Ceratobasidium sp. 392]
ISVLAKDMGTVAATMPSLGNSGILAMGLVTAMDVARTLLRHIRILLPLFLRLSDAPVVEMFRRWDRELRKPPLNGRTRTFTRTVLSVTHPSRSTRPTRTIIVKLPRPLLAGSRLRLRRKSTGSLSVVIRADMLFREALGVETPGMRIGAAGKAVLNSMLIHSVQTADLRLSVECLAIGRHRQEVEAGTGTGLETAVEVHQQTRRLVEVIALPLAVEEGEEVVLFSCATRPPCLLPDEGQALEVHRKIWALGDSTKLRSVRMHHATRPADSQRRVHQLLLGLVETLGDLRGVKGVHYHLARSQDGLDSVSGD